MSSLLLLSKWWLVGLREITFFLDKIIYKLATVSFQVFCYISEITLVDGNQIESLMSRIYVFIGIVMVFVLAYNLLNYIIDPDKVADKKAGAGTFIKDIVLALVIITATPTLFTKLYSFQNTIINSGVISSLLLNKSYSETDENPGLAKVKSGANETVANIYTAFITPKSDDGTGYSALECDDDDKKNQAYCNAYKSAKQDGDISAFSEFVSNDADYEYWPLLSTAAGLGLVFFMMSFCINLGKRAGKLSLLALMAPIPALMEIVPGREGTRKTWFDNLIKTYLEVFVFQAVVFLIIYLLTLIPGVVRDLFASFTGSEASVLIKAFVLVFLIFGLLEFAKEAPKMLMELLGVKSTGIISAGFKRGVAMGGVTGGIIGSTLGRFGRNFTGTEGNVGTKLLSGIGGAGSGLVRNLWGARNVHNIKDAKNLNDKVNKDLITARVNRDTYAQLHRNDKGGVLGAHVVDTLKGTGYKIHDYFNDGYTAGDAQLKSLGEYKNIFDKTKVKTRDDARYMNYQKDLDAKLTQNGLNAFYPDAKEWLKNNSGMTMQNYFTSSEFTSKFDSATRSQIISSYNSIAGDITNLENAMDARKDAMTADKKDDLIIALANAKALSNTNADIARIVSSTGVNLNSLTLDANSSDAEVIKVYKELEKVNKAVGKETTRITAENAQKEYEKKLREASSNNKDKK